MLTLRNHLLLLNQADQQPGQIMDNMNRCVEAAKNEMAPATAQDQLAAQCSLLQFAAKQHPDIENRLQTALSCTWSIPPKEHQVFAQRRRDEMEINVMKATFDKLSAEEHKLRVEAGLLQVQCSMNKLMLEEKKSVTNTSKSKYWKG